MADDGDLDAMATENLGRQDLSDLAEADLFARYSEIGLSQRAIADRLGSRPGHGVAPAGAATAGTRSTPAVDDGDLPSAEAAALAGELPYGPLRRWQKSKDPDQDTDQRRAEQIEAQRLVLEHKWSATAAAERVVAERDARAEAARWESPSSRTRAQNSATTTPITASVATTTPRTPTSSVPSIPAPVTSTFTPARRPATLPVDGEAPTRRRRPPRRLQPAIATPRQGPGTGQDATADAVDAAGKQNRGTADDEAAAIVEKQRAETAAATAAPRLIGGRRARR